jgi:hypothetical protein
LLTLHMAICLPHCTCNRSCRSDNALSRALLAARQSFVIVLHVRGAPVSTAVCRRPVLWDGSEAATLEQKLWT